VKGSQVLFVLLQAPLTVVVGAPINVGAEPIDEPTVEQVKERVLGA
jgi:hypothetical protein